MSTKKVSKNTITSCRNVAEKTRNKKKGSTVILSSKIVLVWRSNILKGASLFCKTMPIQSRLPEQLTYI